MTTRSLDIDGKVFMALLYIYRKTNSRSVAQIWLTNIREL